MAFSPAKKWCALLTIFVTFFQWSPAAAQLPTIDQGDRSSNNRIGGTSFGRIGEKETTPRAPEGPAGQIPGAGSYGVQGISYQVHVLGEVRSPGTYRVSASTRLSEVIQVAGGILEKGSERKIQLRRDGGGMRADLLAFKLFGDLNSNPYLLDNDIILVPLKDRVVQIEGTVKRPGIYELKNEKTLHDLIKLAGGFTPGIVTSVPIKVIRFDQGKKEILDVEPNERELKGFHLRHADVVVAPHKLTEDKVFDYNLGKLPGDNNLFYPSYEERVFVLGAVARPGPYSYNPYYDVRQYLTVAGGTTKLAKLRKVRLITAGGKTVKADHKTEINPGDTIIIPEKYMAPESVVSLVFGITTSILGITTTILTLTR